LVSEDVPAQLAWFRQGSVLAGYRLEAQVGAGGMAVVFRARDDRLGRPVALKILAPAVASDGAFRRRFIAESRAAAMVDDPHIIPVYEAGEANGVLFIAMRFVTGGDLRRVLEQEGALPPDRVAEFISPVASALDAAHGAGLVHRDVKPANILVDARPGRPDHVYLSDFGVSKGAVSSVSLTGHFLGTPDYSAPEQIQGWAVDGRIDQYALACVTYQLLTGSVPFERHQGWAVLLAHLSEPPPSLGSRQPGLPAAADEVLARALAKAPEHRYRSCGDFADALREALGLTSYHPRRSAFTPDHPLTAITTPRGFREPITDGAGKAGIPADVAAAATIDSAPGDGSPGVTDPPAATGIVAVPARSGSRPGAVPPIPPATEEQNVPAAAARASTADGHTAGQLSIPDSGGPVPPTRRPGRLIAIALAAAVVAGAAIAVPVLVSSSTTSSHGPAGSLRTIAAGKLTATLTDPASGGVTSAAFNLAGTMLATSDSNDRTYLWTVSDGKLAATFTTPGSGGITSVAFSPDGTTLAATDNSEHTYLWNILSGRLAATLSDPNEAGFTSVAFSPSGMTLATGDIYGTTCLWNVPDGTLAATLTDPNSGGVTSIAFSPDGETLATSDVNGSTYLWNIATRKLTATLTDPNSRGVTSIALSPDGTTLAAADKNGSTYLWNIATRKLTATLTDPNSRGVTSIAFSADGTTLAAADNDGHTYLWNIATRKLTATLTDPNSGGVTSVAFSGATLATTDNDGRTYLWNIS
jgi:serine/threonine protein kinase